MERTIFTLTVLFLSVLLLASCGKNDGVSFDDGNIKGQVTLPLLPFDLPIFPTDVTLEGAADSFLNWAKKQDVWDLIPDFLKPSESDIEDYISEVEDMLREASLEILQPGVLSVAVKNVVTEAIGDYVKITQIGINFSFANDTDIYVSVPVEFKLFLGEAALAEDWDEAVTVPFEDPRVEDGQFIVAPGETIDLSVEDMPDLVDTLNNLEPIGIGYKSLYRAADVGNGADITGVVEKFGGCILSQVVSGFDFGECPDVEELLGWHLTLKKFDLVIKAETDLNIPEIPGCEEFADKLGLDLLKDACPSGD